MSRRFQGSCASRRHELKEIHEKLVNDAISEKILQEFEANTLVGVEELSKKWGRSTNFVHKRLRTHPLWSQYKKERRELQNKKASITRAEKSYLEWANALPPEYRLPPSEVQEVVARIRKEELINSRQFTFKTIERAKLDHVDWNDIQLGEYLHVSIVAISHARNILKFPKTDMSLAIKRAMSSREYFDSEEEFYKNSVERPEEFGELVDEW